MRVFGIDPGSDRTGYGCIDSDGRRHQLVRCGAVSAGAGATFPDQLVDHLPRALGAPRRAPARVRGHREHLSRDQRAQRAEARARARRRDARGDRGRRDRGRIHAGGDQARGRRLRPRREAAGRADGEDAARPRHDPEAARRDRCARRGDLPPAQWQRPRRKGLAYSRGRPAAALQLASLEVAGATTAHGDNDRAPERQGPREASESRDRRCRRRRLRRAGAALDVLRAAAIPARRSRCGSTRTCARISSRSMALRPSSSW